MEQNRTREVLATMTIQSDMYSSRADVPVIVSVMSQDRNEDMRLRIQHRDPRTNGYSFNFQNSLDVFYVSIHSLDVDEVFELESFCVAMNLDRVTGEPCDKTFHFVGYPFLYAYSIIDDNVFDNSFTMNFKFRHACYLVTGIHPDFQRIMGFMKQSDAISSCNYWLQPEDDLWFYSDSSTNREKLFQRPGPGSSFYVADASFFDHELGISTRNQFSGIWRLDVEFQDFYRCLALRFASFYHRQDDFDKDESLTVELFVDCILNVPTSEYLFKSRIHSAIKILDDVKRSQFGKLIKDSKFAVRLQLVSLALCTRYVKKFLNTYEELKSYFVDAKAKLDPKADVKSTNILGQHSTDYDCLKRMPMHKKAMLVYLVSSHPNAMPLLQNVFADDDSQGCSTFLSENDKNNVTCDVVNLSNAFDKCKEYKLSNLIWPHDQGLQNGRIHIFPELCFILRRLVPMRHADAHCLPFSFVSRQEITLMFDNFDIEVDRIIFEYLDPNDYQLCTSFQKKLLQNSVFFEIKQQQQIEKDERAAVDDLAGAVEVPIFEVAVSSGWQKFVDFVYAYLISEGYTSPSSTVRLSYLGDRQVVRAAKPHHDDPFFKMKPYLEKFPNSFKFSGIGGTLAVYAQPHTPPNAIEQKVIDGDEGERCDLDSAENSEFCRRFNSASYRLENSTCNFLSLFSFMNRSEGQQCDLSARRESLKAQIDQVFQKVQKNKELKQVAIINVCSEQVQLLGPCYPNDGIRGNLEAGAYHHSASFDCMQLQEILGMMFVARGKAEQGIGFKLLLSFCCASFYKSLVDFLPFGQQELPMLLAKVLNLDDDSFEFLQHPGSTGALFTLFDAIADLWAVTWYSNMNGRPFVFVFDNVDWLDYHHFKIKFKFSKLADERDRKCKLLEMRDYVNERLFGGVAKAAADCRTSRLILYGNIDIKSIQADLQEQFREFLYSIKHLFLSEDMRNFQEFLLLKSTRFDVPVVKFIVKSSAPIFSKAFKRSQIFDQDINARVFDIDQNFLAHQNIPGVIEFGSKKLFKGANCGQSAILEVVTLLQERSFEEVCGDIQSEDAILSDDTFLLQTGCGSASRTQEPSHLKENASSLSDLQLVAAAAAVRPTVDPGAASQTPAATGDPPCSLSHVDGDGRTSIVNRCSTQHPAESQISATDKIIHVALEYLRHHRCTSIEAAIHLSNLSLKPVIQQALQGCDTQLKSHLETRTDLFGICSRLKKTVPLF
jgi:hypothetical protein